MFNPLNQVVIVLKLAFIMQKSINMRHVAKTVHAQMHMHAYTFVHAHTVYLYLFI